MASWSGFSFGGWAPIESWYEGGMNRMFNRMSYDDQMYYSALMADKNYGYQLKWAKEGPSAQVAGLEAAGLNPILAANSSAGSFSSSPPLGSLPIRSDSHTSVGGPSPLDWKNRSEEIKIKSKTLEKLDADIETQNALRDLYRSQSLRNGFIPLNETSSGGLNFFGSGFNVGGANTLLFDTRTGEVIRPVSNSASSAAPEPRSSNSAQGREDGVNVSPGLKNALEKHGISLDTLLNMQE